MNSLENFIFDNAASIGNVAHFKPNECIYALNDPFEGVYFILSGSIKLLQPGANGNHFIWLAGPKEIIGITSFANPEKQYKLNATAVSNCKVLFIPTDTFQKILEDEPTFKADLFQMICSRISHVEKLISRFKYSKAGERLIEVLKYYVERHQSDAILQLPLTLQDLALTIGSTPAYIRKILDSLQKKGSVFVKKDVIIIKNKIPSLS